MRFAGLTERIRLWQVCLPTSLSGAGSIRTADTGSRPALDSGPSVHFFARSLGLGSAGAQMAGWAAGLSESLGSTHRHVSICSRVLESRPKRGEVYA